MKTTILIAIALVLLGSNQDKSKADNYEVINDSYEDMKESDGLGCNQLVILIQGRPTFIRRI